MHLYTVEAFAALDLSESFSTGIKTPIGILRNFYNLQTNTQESNYKLLQFLQFGNVLANYAIYT